jgi:hypothetical protein
MYIRSRDKWWPTYKKSLVHPALKTHCTFTITRHTYSIIVYIFIWFIQFIIIHNLFSLFKIIVIWSQLKLCMTVALLLMALTWVCPSSSGRCSFTFEIICLDHIIKTIKVLERLWLWHHFSIQILYFYIKIYLKHTFIHNIKKTECFYRTVESKMFLKLRKCT